MKKKHLYKLILFLFIFFQFGTLYLSSPKDVSTAPLTNASVTLTNSRLSYRAGVSGTPAQGATTVTIDGSGNPDNNTNHLFPGDPVCFSDAGLNGCSDETEYSVNTIADTTNFTFSPGLLNALEASDVVIASQESIMTVVFTLANDVESGGDLVVTVPALDSATDTDDGMPDTSGAVTSNGWDLNTVVFGDVSIETSSSGTCVNNNWGDATVTAGTAVADHTFVWTRTADCEADSTVVTVTIGDAGQKMINPAPITGHSQGTADIYTVDVTTRDSSDLTIDTVDIKTAPIEAVFVSTTVDETLSFTLAGVAASATNCGSGTNATEVTTTVTTVPFGELSSSGQFYDAQHQLTVSTNADSGYEVYAEENDELGLDGDASVTFIPDTPGNTTSATHIVADAWTSTSIYGFGYSLQNSSGTDATFEWDDTTPSTGFDTKQFPNYDEGPTQYTASGAELMSNAGPVNGSSVFVCYRLNISALQDAGYYYNTVRYTAVPSF